LTRLDYAATGRNRDAILEVLQRLLPERGEVLEVASGSGQHTAYFAPHFPSLWWQPSDADPALFTSIEAWAESENIRPPVHLDVTTEPSTWPVPMADVVLCMNMIHIAPWRACEGLVAGASTLLPEGGLLYLYGPYMRGGRHTAPSNEAFDQRLRSRNPEWGVRDLDDVAKLASECGLELSEVVSMPANNLSAVFRRS
jgi:hypothetical protein